MVFQIYIYNFLCDNLDDILRVSKDTSPRHAFPPTVIPVLSREFCSAIEC